MNDTPMTLDRRRAGVLLHPTSLPETPGNGDLGPQAYRFVDFLRAAGGSLWQTLPLGPTQGTGSPYQSPSVHAGNPLLISLEWLLARGWLDEEVLRSPESRSPALFRRTALHQAFEGFQEHADRPARASFTHFREERGWWLEDYALFVALHQRYRGRSWVDWPIPLRNREAKALDEARASLSMQIGQVCFEQYVFFSQWLELKRYANRHGILLFGDMPIFVAHDSADVWAHRDYFDLRPGGRPATVAGVPPDYFSPTGQLWGNPLYRWEALQADGFRWWKQRLRTQLELFDLIRIDHFRGLQAYWEVPADEPTAENGRWVEAPGHALLEALHEAFGALPLVAEDLGTITPEVEALRKAFGIPGMRVLQFAFDGGPDNPYLPHNHEANTVVYTGTHDNDTSCGWFESLDRRQQVHVLDYLGLPQESMPWPLIRSALASTARLAVVPMQDLMGLGPEHRMNTPGTVEGNWQWRYSWDQIDPGLAARVHHLVGLYGRGEGTREGLAGPE